MTGITEISPVCSPFVPFVVQSQWPPGRPICRDPAKSLDSLESSAESFLDGESQGVRFPMQYATVQGERTEAFPGGKGLCPTCSAAAVAKCGPRVMHHWAHAGRRNCDPWWENETPWHREWKSRFPVECREIAHAARSGEIHRADIITPTGIVIEVQHSPMTDAERISREQFYQNLVWVVDGSTFSQNFEIHHMLPEPKSVLAQDLEWYAAGVGLHGCNHGLFTRRSNPNIGIRGIAEVRDEVEKLYRGHHQYVWKRPRNTWLDATCPVYIDFGGDEVLKLDKYQPCNIPCVYRVSKRKFLHDAIVETRADDIATRFYPIG